MGHIKSYADFAKLFEHASSKNDFANPVIIAMMFFLLIVFIVLTKIRIIY